MKRLVITVMTCLVAGLGAFAQTKGTQYVNGALSGSFSSSQAAGMKSWSVGVAPEYGVFVADRLSVGGLLSLEYGHSRSDMFVGNTLVNNWTSVGLGGVVRYHLPIAKWVSYTPSVYLGFTPYTGVWTAAGHEAAKAVAFWGRIQGVSFDFNVSRKFAINLSVLDYGLQTSTNRNAIGSSRRLEFMPKLSFKFYL